MDTESRGSKLRILPPPPQPAASLSPWVLVAICLVLAAVIALVIGLLVVPALNLSGGGSASVIGDTTATGTETPAESDITEANAGLTATAEAAQALTAVALTPSPTATPQPTSTPLPPTPTPLNNLVIAVDEGTATIYVGNARALHLTIYALVPDGPVTTLNVKAENGLPAMPSLDRQINECGSGQLPAELMDVPFIDGLVKLLLCVPPGEALASTVTITAQGISNEGVAVQSGSKTLEVRRDNLAVTFRPIPTGLEMPACLLPGELIINGVELQNPPVTAFEFTLTSTTDTTAAPRIYTTTLSHHAPPPVVPSPAPVPDPALPTPDPAATAVPLPPPPLSGWLYLYRSGDCEPVTEAHPLEGFTISPALELNTPYVGYYVLPPEAAGAAFLYPMLTLESTGSTPPFATDLVFAPAALNIFSRDVNIRDTANANSTALDQVAVGKTLLVTGQQAVGADTWWQVQFNERSGWVNSENFLLIGDESLILPVAP